MKKTFIFDLDNVLYDEFDFIKSGFQYVTSNLYAGSQSIFNKLVTIYNSCSRNGNNDGGYDIFKKFLIEQGTYSKENEMEMVYMYRTHFPKIELHPWVLPLFEKIHERGNKIGVLTNGKAIIQSNKLKALNVIKHTDKYLICDVLGDKYYKPCQLAYKLLIKWMNEKPENCVYIDDKKENVESALIIGISALHVEKNTDLTPLISKIL